MKKTIVLTILVSLTACGMFGGGSNGGSGPVVREEFKACPEAPECAGKYKSGGVCVPSLEHHSTADKCPKIK